MKKIAISTYQTYLKEKYQKPSHTVGLFLKLVEEVGEVAEALNKQRGRKYDDGLSSLSEELADVLHYALAIAAVNDIHLETVILEKDRKASIKYNQMPNLSAFIENKT